jgi:hypothetical protein
MIIDFIFNDYIVIVLLPMAEFLDHVLTRMLSVVPPTGMDALNPPRTTRSTYALL